MSSDSQEIRTRIQVGMKGNVIVSFNHKARHNEHFPAHHVIDANLRRTQTIGIEIKMYLTRGRIGITLKLLDYGFFYRQELVQFIDDLLGPLAQKLINHRHAIILPSRKVGWHIEARDLVGHLPLQGLFDIVVIGLGVFV